MTQPWLLYGANGYTGRLIAEEASRRGERPILAGRDERAVAAVAAVHGFEHRAFDLEDPARIAPNLDGIAAVCLAAGPFSRTSGAMVDACLRARTHYLDISGEIPVLEGIMLRDEEARRAGISLLPAVGFDVVPSDCLAKKLSEALPDGTSLELAISTTIPSGGTARTAIESLLTSGAVRSRGEIAAVPLAHAVIEVPFRDRLRTATSLPLGDVSTAYYSTGIGNIVTYVAVPSAAIGAIRALRPLSKALELRAARKLAGDVAAALAKGPSAGTRARARMQLWGRVTAPDGRVVEGTLTTPEAYALTASTAVEATRRAADGLTPKGAYSPAMAFGAGFIAEFAGCDLRAPRSASPRPGRGAPRPGQRPR